MNKNCIIVGTSSYALVDRTNKTVFLFSRAYCTVSQMHETRSESSVLSAITK